MKLFRLFVVTSLFVQSGFTYSDDAILPKPEIAAQVAEHNKAWLKTRAPLMLNDNSTVTSCAQFFEKHAGVSESVMAQMAASEYLICDVIALLKNSERVSTQPLTGTGKALYTHIDIRSLPTSLSQLADTEKFVFSSINDIPVAITDNSVISDTEDWFFKLEVVAISDLNKNKQQDWIIWMTDEAKDGNYRAYKTLVIYDPPSDAAWRAVLFQH